MKENTDAKVRHDSDASLPFFARFLEGQDTTDWSVTTKFPSDKDEYDQTHKYPSDSDEGEVD